MNGNQILRFVTALGLVLCILGVGFIINGIRYHLMPISEAKIVEIQDTGYIHGTGDDIRNEYSEDVVGQTEDGKTVTVTVKSMDEHTLPVIGDTIRIYGPEEDAREYTSWYGKAGIWFAYGATCLIFSGIILRILLQNGK